MFINHIIHLKARGHNQREVDHEIVRHMVNTTVQHYCTPNPDPIVVHCTEGIGATATFIAFFKLRDELYDTM